MATDLARLRCVAEQLAALIVTAYIVSFVLPTHLGGPVRNIVSALVRNSWVGLSRALIGVARLVWQLIEGKANSSSGHQSH
ncbi:MAG TPA: hypothetical protein VFW40_08325 [Capsulimonadaceae bacterium]|nr:hypothetical protein [Capsulimonadaceae bacterium]